MTAVKTTLTYKIEIDYLIEEIDDGDALVETIRKAVDHALDLTKTKDYTRLSVDYLGQTH